MKNYFKIVSVAFLIFQCFIVYAQNQNKQWRFGNMAGLDFNTNPPTPVASSAMYAYSSCSGISDNAGNLLFYTDGATVWNQNNAIMANGSGLYGGLNAGGTQGTLIIRKPGSSTIYYIITCDYSAITPSNGLFYSIVDMSLAGGLGAVTAQNIPLNINSNSSKITATRHCNGIDIWLVARDYKYNPSNVFGQTPVVSDPFRCYLITSAGINPTPVISTPVSYLLVNGGWSYDFGGLKISSNGKKLGLARYTFNISSINVNSTSSNAFELFDFDNITGVVSNSVVLASNNLNQQSNTVNFPYGVEFSPDGTKFYAGKLNAGVFQWNLCAGSSTAIAASMTTIVPASANVSFGSMMAAPDGKIYIARYPGVALDVIANPNGLGTACNYMPAAQTIAPRSNLYSLPNLIAHNPPPNAFTFTVSNAYGCQTASFNTSYSPGYVSAACNAYTLVSLEWNFGDPASGVTNNTSSLDNPSHAYTTLGTYTAQLLLHYTCGGGTDTIRQVIHVNQPCVSVTPGAVSCAALGTATVFPLGGLGPFVYTWTPSGQTGSVATGLAPGNYTISVHDFAANVSFTAFTSLGSAGSTLTGVVSNNSLACNGIPTGTASIVVANGSGAQNYLWTNGFSSQATATASALSAGNWSVTVTDALTSCVLTKTFTISQPPALTLTLAPASPTACAGGSITISGNASGGTPGYTYTWTGGPQTTTYTVSQALAGNYSYTLQATDLNSCVVSNTIGVTFVNNPTLTVSSVSICPLQTGTLSVSGASTYSWNTGAAGNTFTGSPLVTTSYSVTGEALGCWSTATAAIILKPVPVPTLGSNSPVCNDMALQLSAFGGTAYVWNGPLGFYSAAQNPTVTTVAPSNSGAYSATLTAANGCTASASTNVTVDPTPTLSITGGTVCVTQTLSLSAASFANSTFAWAGPNSFASALQNPFIVSPPVQASGIYSVTVTTSQNCTNTGTVNAMVVSQPTVSFISNSPLCLSSSLIFNAGATSGAQSYSWTGPNGFTSSIQNPTIYPVPLPASGIYTLEAGTGPCLVSYTSMVVINPLPVLNITNSGAACEGKAIQFSATGTGTIYFWTTPGSSFTGANVVLDPVHIAQQGTYTVSTTDVNGCTAFATTPVTVLVNPVVSASGGVVCLNQPSTVTAIGASSYHWQGPGGYTSNLPAAVIPVTGPAATGAYTVIGTAANGCTSVAMANVSIQPLPQPSLIVTPTVCVNAPIELKGFGGVSYLWEGPANFSAAAKDISFAAFSRSSGGMYTLTVTDAVGCKNYTTALVTVYDLPRANLISSNTNRCVPFCSEFKSVPANQNPATSAVWEIDGQTYVDTFRYCFNKAGQYTIKGVLKDANCTNVDLIPIVIHPVPVADFNFIPERPVENMDQVVFTSTSQGNDLKSWTWAVKDNEGNYNASSGQMNYLFSDAGTYPVAMVVSNGAGCSDTIIKLVTVDPDFNIYIPNTFTPNEDGRNDLFMPASRNVGTFDFMIYNRWGEKMFSTNRPDVGWDGTYKGEPCKQDVYVWKLTVKGNNGEEKKLTGFVNLYR